MKHSLYPALGRLHQSGSQVSVNGVSESRRPNGRNDPCIPERTVMSPFHRDQIDWSDLREGVRISPRQANNNPINR